MYFLTKTEKDLLTLLNSSSLFTKAQIMEEICKNATSVSPQQVENALEGCVVKGFVTQTGDGFLKLTEEGKKQV